MKYAYYTVEFLFSFPFSIFAYIFFSPFLVLLRTRFFHSQNFFRQNVLETTTLYRNIRCDYIFFCSTTYTKNKIHISCYIKSVVQICVCICVGCGVQISNCIVFLVVVGKRLDYSTWAHTHSFQILIFFCLHLDICAVVSLFNRQ